MIEKERVGVIGDVWKRVHNNWARKNRLEYVVKPSESTQGKSLEDMKRLSYQVGVAVEDSDLVDMNIEEVTAFFLFMKDQVDQMRKMAETVRQSPSGGNTTISSVVNFAPSDDDIKSVLEQIRFTRFVPEGEATAPNDEYGLTEERVKYVGAQVGKLLGLASGGPRMHFLCYPPQEYLDLKAIDQTTDIYQKLKDTVWWIKWSDGQFVQLRFIEILIFLHQYISLAETLKKGRPTIESAMAHKQSKHAGGWQPKKDRKRPRKKEDDSVAVNVNVNARFSPPELAKDEMIRALLSKMTIQNTTKPNVAVN